MRKQAGRLKDAAGMKAFLLDMSYYSCKNRGVNTVAMRWFEPVLQSLTDNAYIKAWHTALSRDKKGEMKQPCCVHQARATPLASDTLQGPA